MSTHLFRATFAALPALSMVALPTLTNAQSLTDATVEIQNIINSDLDSPTGIAFIGFNDFLLIEKATGLVKHVVNGEVIATVLDLPVNFESERGLLGITLHPDFATNHFVYLYHSRSETDGSPWLDNRVTRYTWTGDALIDDTLIISFPFDATQANGANHDGGIILFGPDGKLYGITGDLNRNRLEQNQTAATVAGVGGIFRLNDDGSTPSDNPFIAHSDPSIQRLYAYGIRNSFGLTFDAQTGNFWDTENGPSSYDEVNMVPPGFNSGWSKIMGPDSRDAQNVSDLVQIPNSVYLDPKLSYLTPVAVTALAFIDGGIMPASWQNTLVMGDANTGSFYRFTLNAARDTIVLTGDVADLVADTTTERNSLRIGTGFGVSTDLETGPDGSLYQVSLNGAVRRIGPIRTIGDLDCDNTVTTVDLMPFVMALTDPLGFIAANPTCNIWHADINSDGSVNAVDIAPMVTLLLNP